MRIISKKMLIDHWHPEPRRQRGTAKAWHAIAKEASWNHFAEVKAQFGSASAVGDRVVFNIAGNKYRLVTFINYEFHTIYVRFVGKHKEYDEIDVEHV